MSRILLTARLSAVALLAGTVFLVGCSRPVGSVKGKVTYQNKALKGGSVALVSSEGRQSFSCSINEDGTYLIPNAIGGDYKVCVDNSSLKPAAGAGGYQGSAGMKGMTPTTVTKGAKSAMPPPDQLPEGYKASNPADAQAATNAKKYVEIPAKYKDAETTDLTIKVIGGDQTFDIDLK